MPPGCSSGRASGWRNDRLSGGSTGTRQCPAGAAGGGGGGGRWGGLGEGGVGGVGAFGRGREEDAAGAGELFALYIDPARWRAGAGRALLHAARERLRDLGFPEAVLWVLCGNDAAEHFYAADGWSRDGSSRWEDPWGVRSQVFRLRRPLR